MVYAPTSHNKRYTLRRLFGGSGLRSARSFRYAPWRWVRLRKTSVGLFALCGVFLRHIFAALCKVLFRHIFAALVLLTQALIRAAKTSVT